MELPEVGVGLGVGETPMPPGGYVGEPEARAIGVSTPGAEPFGPTVAPPPPHATSDTIKAPAHKEILNERSNGETSATRGTTIGYVFSLS